VCILTFNNLKKNYSIQNIQKYQNACILIRTIHNNKKICQMAYMLLNDNIRFFLVIIKIMYENKSIWYSFNVVNSK